MRQKTLGLLALVAGVFAAPAAQADITIGFVTSLSGNASWGACCRSTNDCKR